MDILSVIEHVTKEKLDAVLISFDFEKAFDKVEWNILFEILHYFNFGDNIINMIKVLYTEMGSCVINIGVTSNWFNLSRSVRQGDPLSSSSFLLMIKVLSLQIKNNPDVIGVSLVGCHKTQAQYADDIWVVIVNNQETCDALLKTFDDF